MRRSTETGSFTPEFAAQRVKRQKWKLYPEVVKEVVRIVGVGSVVDVGAGIGHYVAALREAGISTIGIDGIKGIEELSGGLVLEQDFAEPPRDDLYDKTRIALGGAPAWVMSIEVGEHIPRKHEATFFDVLRCFGTRGVILSWASFGQKGAGHINCRTPEYVTQQMVLRGYRFDEEAVLRFRESWAAGIASNFLVFRKRDD